jgi:hypothetical protein
MGVSEVVSVEGGVGKIERGVGTIEGGVGRWRWRRWREDRGESESGEM